MTPARHLAIVTAPAACTRPEPTPRGLLPLSLGLGAAVVVILGITLLIRPSSTPRHP
jgi:hypothetical protein